MKKFLPFIAGVLFATTSFAQCYPDRHNTTWFDSWISCEASMNPNTVRGESHWIHYDLGYIYVLGEVQVWNINDPDNLNRGAQEVALDYSTDGINWTEFDTFFFNQADGSSIYEGFDLVDLDELEAKHLLFTVVSNYGGDCSGFSEIAMEVLGTVTSIDEFVDENACFEVQVYPNPHRDAFKAKVTSACNERMTAALYDAVGREIYSRDIEGGSETNVINFDELELGPGIYFLTVTQGDAVGRYQVMRVR